MKKSIIILFIPLYLSGCSSISRNVSNLIFPPYANSDQRQGEEVNLSLTYKTDKTVDNKPVEDRKNIKKGWNSCVDALNPQARFAFAGMAGAAALGFAIEQVQQFLKDEAKRYTASYSATTIGDHFYTGVGVDRLKTSCKPAREIDLNSIKITRSVNSVPKAMQLSFDIEDSIDSTAFQIVPKMINIKQSKAKIAAIDISRPFGFDILAPWTIFKINSASELSPLRPNKVDVTVQVSIIAVWIDEKMEGHNELIASRELKFGDILLGIDKPLSDIAQQLFPAIPRSIVDKDNKIYGIGNFVISVMVTEYDNFAERVLELEKGIENNKEGIIQQFADDI